MNGRRVGYGNRDFGVIEERGEVIGKNFVKIMKEIEVGNYVLKGRWIERIVWIKEE